MYRSYDLGQGFISGEKEVEEKCNYLADYKPTFNIFKEVISSNNLEIIKEMVNIHQNYAEIVIAIKTQIAGRKVLDDAYNELINIKDIMLDEHDYNMLEKPQSVYQLN